MTDWRFYNIDPFLIREDRVLRESNEIGSRGEGFAAFINSLCVNRPKLFDAYRRSLCSLIPSIESVTVSPRDDGELDVRLVQDGTEQSIRVISEGTLRLMGLLAIAYMPEPPTLLGFEEPENGVHPGRLELIAEIFKSIAARGTQVVLTTHSPYLPEMFDKESLLVCRRGENGTVLQPYLSLDPLGNPLPPGEYLKDADDPDATPISQRILRGDFGD
jgi:predicted ATPase